MKTKLEMAHEYAIALINSDSEMQFDKFIRLCWDYADAMQAEADKREKEEAAQKRKEIREMLNSPNTFVEREGQHFDDVEEWQPDWSQAPEWAKWLAMDKDGESYYFGDKPEIKSATWMPTGTTSPVFLTKSNYQGDWKDSLRERPE